MGILIFNQETKESVFLFFFNYTFLSFFSNLREKYGFKKFPKK